MTAQLKRFGQGLCLLGLAVFNVHAGDIEAGKEKAAQVCASCHGETGVAIAPLYPNLAGQYESYLVHALKAYRSGDRANAIMMPMAAALTDEDIANLAAYYAAQEGALQTVPRP
ncbi:MAG: cytochrome c [Gammaproteobacteria bacterium]|nr:cytochrome c [Gammaproteobacteria bacterium]